MGVLPGRSTQSLDAMTTDGEPARSKWQARIGSALISTAVAAAFFGFFGSGVMAWNVPTYWALLAMVFIVALILHGKVD
jgi:hypothetical protein